MDETRKYIRIQREKRKIECFRTFSDDNTKLDYTPFQQKRSHLHPLIMANYDIINLKGTPDQTVLQCRVCRTIHLRPKRHYWNLRKHLLTRYHKRLEQTFIDSEKAGDEECDEDGEEKKELETRGENETKEITEVEAIDEMVKTEQEAEIEKDEEQTNDDEVESAMLSI